MTSRTFKHDGFTVILSAGVAHGAQYDPRTDDHKICVEYTIKDDADMIFHGNDLHVSPMHAWDSTATIGTLAAFFARGEDDCDSEWWDRLTPDQRAWCNSPRAVDFSIWGEDTERRALARQHGRMTRDQGLRWTYR